MLANAEIVLALGNLAGIVVSLCVVAVWCLLEERFVRAGVICLAISLALKPHDAALVWFYFLLVGGAYRKRALQTVVVVAALAVPAVLWASYVSPQWPQELRANLHALSAHGSVNDPGPDSLSFRSADNVISLQCDLQPPARRAALLQRCQLFDVRIASHRRRRSRPQVAPYKTECMDCACCYCSAIDAAGLPPVLRCEVAPADGSGVRFAVARRWTSEVACRHDDDLGDREHIGRSRNDAPGHHEQHERRPGQCTGKAGHGLCLSPCPARSSGRRQLLSLGLFPAHRPGKRGYPWMRANRSALLWRRITERVFDKKGGFASGAENSPLAESFLALQESA